MKRGERGAAAPDRQSEEPVRGPSKAALTALPEFEWRRAAVAATIEGEAHGEGRLRPSATQLIRERQTMKITDFERFRLQRCVL